MSKPYSHNINFICNYTRFINACYSTIIKKLLFILLCLITGNARANNNTDSLLNLVNNTNKYNKISLYIKLTQNMHPDSFRAAYSYSTKAYILASQIKNNQQLALACQNMAQVFVNAQIYDSAIFYYQKTLDIAKTNTDNLLIAQTQQNIGDAFYQNNNYDSARFYFINAAGYYSKTNNIQNTLQLYKLIASSYFLQSKYSQTIDYINLQIQLILQLNDTLKLAKAYSDMATNLRRTDKINSAIEYANKALNLYSLKNNAEGIAESYMNLGSLFYYSSIYDPAIKYFKQALEIYESEKIIDKQLMVTNNIGSVYNEMQKYPEALKYYQKALLLYQNQNNPYAMAIISGNIGLVYTQMGQYKQAQTYFEKSLNINKSINNTGGIIQGLANMGQLYKYQNQTALAIKNYQNALNMAIENNYLSDQMEIYHSLSEIYENCGKFDKALSFYKNYRNINDSIINKESRDKLNDAYTQYQLIEKQNKINLLNKENELNIEKMKQQKYYIISIIIVSTLLSILIIITLLALHYVNKSKKQIETKNQYIELQNKKIAIANKRINDGISYAAKVQNAINQPNSKLSQLFNNHFLISKPQNIVSGDFCWAKKINNVIYIAVADCTGHGLTGAFMSILGHTIINHVINNNTTLLPNQILDKLNTMVNEALNQKSSQSNTDIFDIAVCAIDTTANKINYSGAHINAYLTFNNSITELKCDKQPVGISHNQKPFTLQTINYKPGHKLYMLTDGFYNQLGGTSNTKITRGGFKSLLLAHQHLPINEQRQYFESYFDNWRGKLGQTDDMLILAVEL